MNAKYILTLVLTILSVVVQSHGAKLSPVVLASTGTVTANGAPIAEKQSIKVGSIIETGKDSKAAVAIAPGQLVVLRENSKVKLLESSVETIDGQTTNVGKIELLDGSAGVSVTPSTTVKHKCSVVRPGQDEIHLVGTLIEVSPTTVMVIEGTVMISSGGALVAVSGGQVLIATAGGLAIVNLTTGAATDLSGNAIALSPITLSALAQAFANAAALAIASGYNSAQLSAILAAVESVRTGLIAGASIASSDIVIPALDIVISDLQSAISRGSGGPVDIYSPNN